MYRQLLHIHLVLILALFVKKTFNLAHGGGKTLTTNMYTLHIEQLNEKRKTELQFSKYIFQ